MADEPTPLQRAVEVMDRLRSPGGCPWDAAQTHESLVRYLVEECYEVIEAIETGDPVLLREELGDLLLQVLFHARLAEELPTPDAFGIEDVAADLHAKLVRRHPHVFAVERAAAAAGPNGALDEAALNEAWEAQKVTEKGRTSATDGVPLAQPALALAAKLVSRAQRVGLDPPTAPTGPTTPTGPIPPEGPAADLGARLFALVREAVAEGIDPETALRTTARAYRAALLAAEADAASPSDERSDGGSGPGSSPDVREPVR